MAVVFTSCSDNDDPTPDSPSDKLTINRVQYDYDGTVYFGSTEGLLGVAVDFVNTDKTISPCVCLFEFDYKAKPKAGDDLAKAELKLDIYEWDDYTYRLSVEADYMGGKAIIKSIDSETVTVQFSNLTMEVSRVVAAGGGINHEHAAYTFNGTITVPFYF